MTAMEGKDAYEFENYERNEAAIQSQSQNQKIEEIQREIFNVKTELIELNKMTRYSFFLFGIVILLLSPSAFILGSCLFGKFKDFVIYLSILGMTYHCREKNVISFHF